MKEITYLNRRLERIYEFVNPKRKDKILVIGTGTYPQIEEIIYIRKKCKIISGDINLKNINNGKKILKNVKFIFLDAQKKFNLKNDTFDKVILTEVLEHLKYEDIALKEINRVLKNKGYLIISVPKRRWFNIFSPITHIQHIREYDEKK